MSTANDAFGNLVVDMGIHEFPFLPSHRRSGVSLRLFAVGCERGRRMAANRELVNPV